MDTRYEDGALRMLSGLLDTSHLVAFKDLPREVNRHARAAGLRRAAIFMADLCQISLREMTGPGPEARAGSPRHHPVEGSAAGRAFQLGTVVPQPGEGADAHRWWIPLLDGTERLGVLEVTGEDGEDATLRNATLLASMVALILVSRSESSDAYPRLKRTETMSTAAELQWNLMPPQAYADDYVVISGVIEPVYRVGGDAFDYALADDTVHLAVFDAMGHDVRSGVAANLAVAEYRAQRRRGRGLVATTEAIERFLIEVLGREQFVTAVLAELDTRTGELRWVNRGHPQPIIIRDSRWSTHPECPPAHPMGTDLGRPTTLCRVQLEPGDRVVLYSDGVTEARDEGGVMFGVERFTDFLIRRHADRVSVSETLRRLVRAITNGDCEAREDDTTVLLAEWIGPDPGDRRRSADDAGYRL
jgi:serine phosphatase RsbU (regulator of sigma subunit)